MSHASRTHAWVPTSRAGDATADDRCPACGRRLVFDSEAMTGLVVVRCRCGHEERLVRQASSVTGPVTAPATSGEPGRDPVARAVWRRDWYLRHRKQLRAYANARGPARRALGLARRAEGIAPACERCGSAVHIESRYCRRCAQRVRRTLTYPSAATLRRWWPVLTKAEIARRVGCSVTQLYRHVRTLPGFQAAVGGLGPEQRAPRVAWPPLATLTAMVRASSAREVGRQLGCTGPAVRWHIRREQDRKQEREQDRVAARPSRAQRSA